MRRDGAACYQYQHQHQSQSQGGLAAPPYYPSSFQAIDAAPRPHAALRGESWSGRVVEFESRMGEDDLEQPRDFWERILAKEPGQQENLVSNVAEHLAEAAPRIREKAYGRCFPFFFPPSLDPSPSFLVLPLAGDIIC